MILHIRPTPELDVVPRIRPAPTSRFTLPGPAGPRSVASPSTFRYHGIAPPPRICWLAVLASVALHAGLLLGFNQAKPRPKVVVHEEPVEQLQMVAEVKDPEEEMPKELNDSEPLAAPSVSVPTLADIPVLIPVDSAFLQPLDLTIPLKSDATAGLVAIPTNIRHGRPDAGGIKNLFDISELDKAPEPIVKTPPSYPWEMKREGIDGQVRVGFIVDSNGDVIQPYIVSSDHEGFERAALAAVAKWRFRPGIKNGRKVNTRVVQPMNFKVHDGI